MASTPKNEFSTPTRAKMSSSLRERLKKQGRYHASPQSCSSVATKTNTELSPAMTNPPLLLTPSRTPLSVNPSTPSMPSLPTANRPTRLYRNSPGPSSRNPAFTSPKPAGVDQKHQQDLEMAHWRGEVKKREEILRKLRLVKVYRSKNDLEQLGALIGRWRTACRQAILDLRDRLSGSTDPSLEQLIDQLGFDHKLIGYNAEEECFDDD